MVRLRTMVMVAINLGLMVFVVLIMASALGGCASGRSSAPIGVLEERPSYKRDYPRCQRGFILYCQQIGPTKECGCVDKEQMRSVLNF